MTLIKTSDFFDDGYKKDLQEIATEWRKLGEDIENVIKQLKKAGVGYRSSLEQMQGNTSEGQEQIKKMAKEIQQLEKIVNQLTVTKKAYNKESAIEREQNRQNTALKKANAQYIIAEAGSYNKLSASLKLALIQIKKINTSTLEGRQKFDETAKSIHRMRESLKRMDAQMNSHRRNVGNYQSGLKGLMGTVKRLAAVYLGFEAFRSAVRTTKDLTVQTDSLRLAYSKIIPDSEKLAKTNQFLRQTAENYGIDLNSLRKNYLRFTAASKSSNLTMQETQAIFNSVAKAGSVMGLEAIRMDRAFNALEQMLSKGKVSSEELRQQLGDSLPGSMEIMAEALDVTTLELSKMLEEGKILSDEALPKFAKQLEITYGIENLTRVDNLAAAQGRLKTAIIELVESMETTGTFRDFYSGLTDGVKFVTRNIDSIKNLIKALVSLGLAYGAFRFGVFIQGMTLSTAAVRTFTAAIIANPIGAWLAGITAVVTALFSFRKELGLVYDDLKDLEEVQQKVNDRLEEWKKLNDESTTDDYQKKLDDQTKFINREERLLRIKALSNELDIISIRMQKLRERGYVIDEIAIDGLEKRSENIKKSIANLWAGQGVNLTGVSKSFTEDVLKFVTGEKKKQAEDKEKARKELEAAKAAEFKKEQAIIDTMKDGFEKRERLLKLNRDREAWEWRGHKDLLLRIEEKYQRELDELEASRKFEEREGSINEMQDGLLKELALLKLKHDKEDAELEKRGKDVTKNDARHFRERLALLYKYYSEAEDARMKAIDEENKEREALMKESIDDAKKLLSEQEALNKSSISLAKSQGMGGADLKLYENALDIQYLEKKLDLSKQLNLNSYEEYEIETKLLELRKNAQALFLKTDVGQKAMSAVFGFNFGKPDKKKEGLSELNIFGFDANKLLGLEDDELALVVEGFGIAKNAMADYYRTAIELSNQLVQQRNQEVASAERALDREIASRNAGYANFVDDAQRRLNEAKKNQEEALRQRQEFQRQQLIADSIIQASSLATAAAKLWGEFSVGAIPLIAVMFGSFASAKLKALELTKQEFSEGDLSIIGGGRHGSGNDTLVGFSGGRAQFAEQGEARMILSRRVTAKYKDVLPDLFESLNRGTFDIDALKRTNSPIPSLVVNARTDTSRMEKELVAIRRQGETQTIYDNGKKVVIKGNRIKRYV